MWEFCDSRRRKVSFFSLTVFLLPKGLSLGILTGFQGQASPPLLSGNTGTALLSCQTGLDIGPHSPRHCSHALAPRVSSALFQQLEEDFKKHKTCSCSSHIHTLALDFPSPLDFIFSLGSAQLAMNELEHWNAFWSSRTRPRSPANTYLHSSSYAEGMCTYNP